MSSMYNKLFTKILDSSIWLESNDTRIVWITLIAAMDERGFCAFSAPQNLASRAFPVRAPDEALHVTHEAIVTLEGPDTNSADPENDGRRIERVPGGWMVLNSEKYRALATKAIVQAQTRERVARHRDKKRDVTNSNGEVTARNTIRSRYRSSIKEEKKDTPSSYPKKSARQLVEEFQIEAKHREWAAKSTPSVDVDAELEAWKDRERANDYTTGRAPGKPVANAQAAFYTACRNAEKWGTYRGGSAVPSEAQAQLNIGAIGAGALSGELQQHVDELREAIRQQSSAVAAWRRMGSPGSFPVAHMACLFADEGSWDAYMAWLESRDNELSTDGRLNDFAEFQRQSQDGG